MRYHLPLRHWARAVTLGMRRLPGSHTSVARPTRLGPEPYLLFPARPVTRTRSRSDRLGSSRRRARSRYDRLGWSRRPGPEPHVPLWLIPYPGPGADHIGSSRLPGPEPYRPQWLVPLLRARSRVDRLGSSRHPGPEPSRPHGLVPFPGPGAVSVTGHFCAGPLVSVCLALALHWAETFKACHFCVG